MTQKSKSTKNRLEKTIGFVYVSLLFAASTIIGCLCLTHYANDKTVTDKKFVIAKMDRIREFQNIQNKQEQIIDSMYNKIRNFDPTVNASYEEDDIKFYLNVIERLHGENSYDGRYRIFYQISAFYNMWFADKKELWSKQQNIARFRKNLEECEIGFQKKTEELKNSKK